MSHQKVRGAHLAVGFWSRDPNCRVKQEQLPQKLKALLQDKLIAMGRPADLWLPVSDTTPGTVPCTCDKNTRPGSDFRCLSCYGCRKIPGYLRFMHQLVFFSSAEASSFTLAGTEVDTSIKPNRIRLTAAALTGTVVTSDKPFDNAAGLDWEFQVAAFRKTATDTILVEFSTDAGLTWTDIVAVNGPNRPKRPGNIRFRITLTRAALTTDSPDFEILRLRRRQPELQSDQTKIRKDLLPGQILVLRTWAMSLTMRQIALARDTDFQGDKAWTADLAFFNTALTPDSTEGLITDAGAGPHPMFQHANGVTAGTRFALYQISHNDQFLQVLTHMAFADRRVQPGEAYGLIF